MEERSYRFSEQKKAALQKRIFDDKELPSMEGYEVQKISYMDGCKVYLIGGGWASIRFSGTEPLLRVFCEMPSKEEAASMCRRFENCFEL